MDEDRRTLLNIAAAGGAAALLASAGKAQAQQPSPTRAVPPGNPGDFNFLSGEWRIHNRFLESLGHWIEFPGEATVHPILAGIGSVEELRIPARNFSGMGLRLLDVQNRVWSDFWVNARSGVLTTPGQTGGFVDGVGTFLSEDTDNGQPILARGVWDRIVSGRSHRWFQSTSRDGGRTWDDNWYMDWTRA